MYTPVHVGVYYGEGGGVVWVFIMQESIPIPIMLHRSHNNHQCVHTCGCGCVLLRRGGGGVPIHNGDMESISILYFVDMITASNSTVCPEDIISEISVGSYIFQCI